MESLHRYAEELQANPQRVIARLLLRLLAVKPPQQESQNARSLTTAAARWGPFRPGTIVRVTASCNAWYAFGGPTVFALVPPFSVAGEPVEQSTVEGAIGVPIAAWTFVDHLVVGERAQWVSMQRDVDAIAPLYGVAYDTGSILTDEP